MAEDAVSYQDVKLCFIEGFYPQWLSLLAVQITFTYVEQTLLMRIRRYVFL